MTLLAAKERGASKISMLATGRWSGEVAAFCPGCKALQTVWINSDKLMPTRKFTQERNEVYHDCGSNQPCRLYRMY
jgi:hypothetical protein